MRFWTPAAVAFLVAGVLEVMFLGLSVLGTLVGGVMSFGELPAGLPREADVLGPLLVVFYGLWFLATLVAGPLHLAAGGALLMGRRPRALVWVAVVASLVPVVTVYCAPTSLIAGVLGLLALASKEGKGGAAPTA